MGPGQRLRSALRAFPLAVDALLAVAIGGVTLLMPHPDRVAGDPTPTAALVLAAAACLALTVRRRWPRAVLLTIVAGISVATVVAQGRPLLTFGVGLAVYTVAVRTDRRTTIRAAGATALVLSVASLAYLVGEPISASVDPVSSTLGLVGIAAAVGDAVRSRSAYVAEVEDRAVRAEQTREEEARRQVAEERLRIARELHDVVAHHVAVVSVQAGLAQHLVFKQPQSAYDALAHVQQASAAILEELDGILNVLRRPDEPSGAGGAAPAPGLQQLDALISSYTEAGLHVNWSLAGQPGKVPDTVDLVAYRVVQEALTNAHKYGTGTAHVSVRYLPTAVCIEVTNPMREGQAAARGTGHGLLGMQERATAVGGVLTTGPDPHHQFKVAVTLPVQAGAA